jgi:quinol monooxygenase YgiN
MIIVLGSVIVKDGYIEDALAISQAHVDHSRTEPGCIAHGVHVDKEHPQRLVFVEKWVDYASLSRHFEESTSLVFVEKLKQLITQTPEMEIYEASQLN